MVKQYQVLSRSALLNDDIWLWVIIVYITVWDSDWGTTPDSLTF